MSRNEFNELKQKHNNMVLVFRVGDNYFTYYEDAKKVASAMTKRRRNVSMFSVPCNEKYRLVETMLRKYVTLAFMEK